jgi:hypothetical protein
MVRMVAPPRSMTAKGHGTIMVRLSWGSSAIQLRQWNPASAEADPVGSEHHIAAAKSPNRCPPVFPGSPNSPDTLFEVILQEVDMQDPVTKAEHYRKAANKYGEMAKLAEVDYVAEIYRKVAVRYVFMAEDLLNWSERRREVDVNALAEVFLDRQAA